jgi:hypothetical protein
MSESTDTPKTQEITIQKLLFTAPAPYAEGHPLTAAEAGALNQTFAENLRNNFAPRVKAAQESAGDAGLSAETIAKLREDFEKYADDYEFAGKRQARIPIDPVTRAAKSIAQELLNSRLAAKGLKKADLGEGVYDTYVAKLIETKPEITEEAKRRVAAVQSVASDSLDDLELPAKPAESAEPTA